MIDVVIVAATRTAIGSFQGSLAEIPAPELGAIVIRRLLEQTGGEQFGFQHVKHRPAGRAVHLAQALGVAAGDVHVGEIVARSGAAHATACDIAPAKPGLWLKRLRCRGDAS